MRWSDWDPYLRTEHLRGQTWVLEIERVAVEEPERNGHKTKVPILYFKDAQKGLVLNPSNRQMLKTLFGDEVEGCLGHKVTLQADPSGDEVGEDGGSLQICPVSPPRYTYSMETYRKVVDYLRNVGRPVGLADPILQLAQGDEIVALCLLQEE